MNIDGVNDSVFNVISAFLFDNNQRFDAEVEAMELEFVDTPLVKTNDNRETKYFLLRLEASNLDAVPLNVVSETLRRNAKCKNY